MSKGLVIVESPAKAKTIQKYLGKGFTVDASFGHVKDLPKSSLGVDVENHFDTEYVVIPGKEKILAKLKKLALSADRIYLAPDPDREGEAIAAHLADELGEESGKKKKSKGKAKTTKTGAKAKTKTDDIGDDARIRRAPKTGAGPTETVWSGASGISGLAVDACNVYWTVSGPTRLMVKGK